MRILIGRTRLDLDGIEAYREEVSTSETVVKVFLASGLIITLDPRYEKIATEDMLEKLDGHFLEGEV